MPCAAHVTSSRPLPQIFPLFRALGANGLLIEYEDMFPYEGPLRLLRAPHAYRYLPTRVATCRENGVEGWGRQPGGAGMAGENFTTVR